MDVKKVLVEQGPLIMTDHTQCCSQALTRALNDHGDLGLLTRGVLNSLRPASGDLPFYQARLSVPSFYPSAFIHSQCASRASCLHDANIILHLRAAGPFKLDGDDMW